MQTTISLTDFQKSDGFWYKLKIYWSLLNTLNSSIISKNKFISNIRDKAELFHNFFCAAVYSDWQFKWNSYVTEHKNNQNTFINSSYQSRYCQNNKKNLEPNKAHGHEMISIRTLNLCGDPVLLPLELIF